MAYKGDVKTVTIANGASDSGVIDMREHTLLAVKLPASFDGTRLCVKMAETEGGTYAVMDETVASIDVTGKGGKWVVFNGDTAAVFAGWFIKLYFDDGAGTPQNQTAQRSLTVVKKFG